MGLNTLYRFKNYIEFVLKCKFKHVLYANKGVIFETPCKLVFRNPRTVPKVFHAYRPQFWYRRVNKENTAKFPNKYNYLFQILMHFYLYLQGFYANFTVVLTLVTKHAALGVYF